MNEQICGNCRWWYETDKIITVPAGWCHRMPHTEPTNKSEWCGEFEPRPQVTPPDPQHGRNVKPKEPKPLAQCLAEHIKYQHSTNIIFWEIGDLMKDIEQALDAYQSTENVKIRIEPI